MMPNARSTETRPQRSIKAGIVARAVLRQKYSGCWVAWAADSLDRVIASAKTWSDLRNVLAESHVDLDSVVLEWIDSVSEIPAPTRE